MSNWLSYNKKANLYGGRVGKWISWVKLMIANQIQSSSRSWISLSLLLSMSGSLTSWALWWRKVKSDEWHCRRQTHLRSVKPNDLKRHLQCKTFVSNWHTLWRTEPQFGQCLKYSVFLEVFAVPLSGRLSRHRGTAALELFKTSTFRQLEFHRN